MAGIKKYTDDMGEKLIKYFYDLKRGESTETEYFADGEVKREKPGAPIYPTFEMFARSIGVDNSSLYLWEKEYPKFKEAMDMGRDAQKAWLQQLGLSKVFDPNMAKYLLSVRWRDEFGEVQKVEGGLGLDIVVNYGKKKEEPVPEETNKDEGVSE